MADRLMDKVCFVTGGGAGLGEATSRLFGEEGARVAVVDINAADAERVAREIADAGGDALACACDVADEAAIQAAVEATIGWGRKIDVLVNNAAVGGADYNCALTDVDMKEWERAARVNVAGPIMCMKHIVPHMVRQGSGAIVNVGSISSVVGLPLQAIYAPTKAAIVQLTRQAAVEYTGQGIRINCVLPGGMHTPMLHKEIADPDSKDAIEKELELLPIGRYADPREVAYAILFLASDEASFVIGASLSVDGGYTAM